MCKAVDILRLVNADVKCAEIDERYKPADQLTKYKRLTVLIKCGYRIPYHHRPKCKYCGHRYYPNTEQDFSCAECSRIPKKQKLSLSPTDCLELNMTYAEIMRELALPDDKALYALIDDWTDTQEDILIQTLKTYLGED